MEADIFWEKVNKKLLSIDKTKEWLCDKVGINYGSMRNKIHMGRMPSFDEAMKIIKALGFTMEGFEAYPEAAQTDTLTIPVYEQAYSAGKGQFVPEDAEVIEYIAVPADLKHYADKLMAAYVRGDSMEPTLYDGDRIIFDNMGFDGDDGIYAIIFNGSGFVKRLQRGNGYMKIISDNKAYEPMEEPGESDNFSVVGKVRYVLHKM